MSDTPLPQRDRFITQEAFERWCEEPVTRFVAASYEAMVEVQRVTWERMSWDGGQSDPNALLELRTRADCYAGFYQTDYLQHASHLIEEPRWRKFFEERAKAEREARLKEKK